ncbi:unnamed protein product [Onchocerca flexuosa]|uniref:3-hydroxyisobutyryl-coenzyme A hydrolase n=1 Tax=Onchocerca flexuosa TaxID=387005 RepID=A0A183I6T7_9BILA|nr:unnamed protein product [Onchocerca flexuosa]
MGNYFMMMRGEKIAFINIRSLDIPDWISGIYPLTVRILIEKLEMSKVVRNSWILASCSTKILSVPWQFQRCNFASAMHMIKTEKVGDKRNVGLIKLHRPKALNALCSQLMQELSDALVNFENDSSIGAVVLTGSKRVFSNDSGENL